MPEKYTDKVSDKYREELMRLYNSTKNERYAVSEDKLKPPDPFAAAGVSPKFPPPDESTFGVTASPQPKKETPLPETVPDTSGTEGYLQAEITTGGSFPIKSAVVTITELVDGKVVIRKILFSDQNGRTETAVLSAEAPEGSPYKPYTIKVTAEGYYASDDITVPIFPDIKSIQPVDLIPLPEGTQ